MSDAIELYKQDGSATGIFYCSECRLVYRSSDEAKGCHGERICVCGKPIERYYSECAYCRDAKWKVEQAAKELARFEAAEKVPYADYKGGMLYCGDRYYDDLEALEDYLFDAPLPPYAWACQDVGVPKADSQGIVEYLLEGMWEDADHNDLSGLEELDAAIEKFNEANSSISVWQPDYSTAILLTVN